MLFLWAKVNKLLPTPGILEPLYEDSLTFIGQKSGFGELLSKRLTRITLPWASVSIL